MRLELYGDRILVLCDAVEERKIGSLYVADKHSERTRLATVISVGDTVSKYRAGDRILLSWYTGVHVHLLGEKLWDVDADEDRHRLVMESEILGKIVPD